MRTGSAAVLVRPDLIETWTVDIAEPEPGGVLVEVVLGGVCGSDLHIANGEAGLMPFPIILGHEGVGRIIELGAGVITDHAGVGIKRGDLVYWSPIVRCHRCYSCTVLEETPCQNSQFFEDASRPNWGSFADYAWLPNGMAFFRLPDTARPDAIAALGCALPTILRGFESGGAVRPGEVVVIQGAGPVGLAAAMVASLAGAGRIIVIDQSETRLAIARALGATDTISLSTPAEDRRREIYDLSGPAGPSLVVEAAGALPAFPEGVDLVGAHGRYIVMGLWGAIGTQAISPKDLTVKNMAIAGASFAKPKHYFGAMHLATAVQDRFPLADLISHRFPVSGAARALDAIKSGAVVKAVIDPACNK